MQIIFSDSLFHFTNFINLGQNDSEDLKTQYENIIHKTIDYLKNTSKEIESHAKNLSKADFE